MSDLNIKIWRSLIAKEIQITTTAAGLIRMFLGLTDPDPLVRGMDPDPNHSIIKQKLVRKTLIPTV